MYIYVCVYLHTSVNVWYIKDSETRGIIYIIINIHTVTHFVCTYFLVTRHSSPFWLSDQEQVCTECVYINPVWGGFIDVHILVNMWYLSSLLTACKSIINCPLQWWLAGGKNSHYIYTSMPIAYSDLIQILLVIPCTIFTKKKRNLSLAPHPHQILNYNKHNRFFVRPVS